MAGSFIVQYGAKDLKRKWNIPAKSPAGIVVIFGYPKYKYKSGIKRSFADVAFIANWLALPISIKANNDI